MDLSCSSINKIVLRSFDPGFHMSGDHKACLLSFPNRGFTEALSPGPLKCHRRRHLTIPWEASGTASEPPPLKDCPRLGVITVHYGYTKMEVNGTMWLLPQEIMNPFKKKKKKTSLLNGFNLGLGCPKKSLPQ